MRASRTLLRSAAASAGGSTPYRWPLCTPTSRLDGAGAGGPAMRSGLRRMLRVSDEVEDALRRGRPVVALESTIYTHGAIGSDLGLEAIVRRHGAVPAVIGILAGVPTVGLTPDEIERMVSGDPKKVSRRDLAYLVGLGMTGRNLHGGTTVAGTMLLARLAGIRVFGTGGLGGVHRGWASSLDISADLTELGKTRVAVVSSGCKGFLDIRATLEYLETEGVLVSTFTDGRSELNTVDFPAFWSRDSGVKSPSVVHTEREAAAMILAQEQLGIEAGLLFANPIPGEFEIPLDEMRGIINDALIELDKLDLPGNEITPFILQWIRMCTDGRSVNANKALVQANVARAAKIASELSLLSTGGKVPGFLPSQPVLSVGGKAYEETASSKELRFDRSNPKVDVLVAGSVALDLSCDLAAADNTGKATSPILHTSNPAIITQTVGGVGHNVALAAHRVSRDTKVRLCSVVGDDIAGATILSELEATGMDTSCIRQLGHEYHSARTAQYVAVNDSSKDLVVAMADMGILTSHSFSRYWASAIAASRPSWLVVDGNWSEHDIQDWIKGGRKHHAKVGFEPVSAHKAARLFPRSTEQSRLHSALLLPNPIVDLATPNSLELAAMYYAAKEHGYLDGAEWFGIVDAFGMRGSRDRFTRLTSAEITDAGTPQQAVQLLPYIPLILTKLGPRGVLLTMILAPGDPRLKDPDEDRFVLARNMSDHPHVGGIYMRLFPAVEEVQDIVSVNGVGDTFMGSMVAGLAQGARAEQLVDIAQRAAVMTLRSHQAVSQELGKLEAELREVASRSRSRLS